jgi:hypothetical protein
MLELKSPRLNLGFGGSSNRVWEYHCSFSCRPISIDHRRYDNNGSQSAKILAENGVPVKANIGGRSNSKLLSGPSLFSSLHSSSLFVGGLDCPRALRSTRKCSSAPQAGILHASISGHTINIQNLNEEYPPDTRTRYRSIKCPVRLWRIAETGELSAIQPDPIVHRFILIVNFDIQNSFSQIKIHPSDHEILGNA